MTGARRAVAELVTRVPGDWLIVLALTAVAAWLRFARVGDWSVWGDEIYTFLDAQDSLSGKTPASLRTMPLAHILTLLSQLLFGTPTSEFNIRFFPALTGTLVVPALYALTHHLIGRREALVAALLATFTPWFLFQSQFARYYSLLFLLSSATAFLFLDAMRRASLRTMIASSVCFALAGLTHPTAYFLLPVFGLYALLNRPPGTRGVRRRLAIPYLIVLGVVLVGALLNQDAVRRTIGYSLDLSKPGADKTVDIAQGLTYNLGIQVAFLALLGLPLYWRQDRSLAFFLGLLTAVPFAIVAVLAVLGKTVEERYLIPSLGGYLALAARPVAQLDRVLACARPRMPLLALLAVVVPFMPGVASHYRDGNRHDMRAAAQFVRDRKSASDLVVAEAHRLFALYAGCRDYEVVEAPPQPTQPRVVRKVERYFQGALWVVIPDEFVRSPGPEGDFARWTEQHCRLVAEFHSPRYDYHQNILRVFRRERP